MQRLKHLPRWLTLGAFVAVGVIVLVTVWILTQGATTFNPHLGPPRVSLSQEMIAAVPLDRSAIVIGEDTYAALLAHGGEVSPLPDRFGAAALAASLADPAALGVVATLRHGPARIRSNLFIVVRDPALSRGGELEARDVFVVSGELSGIVPWYGRSPRLALLAAHPGTADQDASRGCRPIFDTRLRAAAPVQFSSSRPEVAGLPSSILLNLESDTAPSNASGYRPRLVVFGTNRAHKRSIYECHTPVGWEESQRTPRIVDREIASPARSVVLPGNAILIGERDFLEALSHVKKPQRPAMQDVRVEPRTLALANADEASGVFAWYDDTVKTFSGDLFAVARNPVLTPGGRLMATEYYLVPVRLSGTAGWLGRLPAIGLVSDIPGVSAGFCGLVSSPVDVPPAVTGGVTVSPDGSLLASAASASSGPGGTPAGYVVESGEPGFGTDRWPAGRRVTLRVPVFEPGRPGLPDFSAIACSDHWPPPEHTAAPAGASGGGVIEVCNGVDDNGDGYIDEGDVCADRRTGCANTSMTRAAGATCAISGGRTRSARYRGARS
jgi:hypothetical protein